MKHRVFIYAMVLALVLVPCSKISQSFAKAAPESSVSMSDAAELAAHWAGMLHAKMERVVDGSGDGPICKKSCKIWQGVVPRVDDAVVPQTNVRVFAATQEVDATWPATRVNLVGSGPRSPPGVSGTVFDAFYAKTSRFLS